MSIEIKGDAKITVIDEKETCMEFQNGKVLVSENGWELIPNETKDKKEGK